MQITAARQAGSKPSLAHPAIVVRPRTARVPDKPTRCNSPLQCIPHRSHPTFHAGKTPMVRGTARAYEKRDSEAQNERSSTSL